MKTLIKNIKELVQVETSPRRMVKGSDMAKISTVKNAYLVVEDGRFAAFGSMDSLPEGRYDTEIDASGRMVFPAFCDSHTHLVYAGSREI
ncbi:MAG: imidazolonepropionase, partial [Bacteroidales bacterium]|nr:imidazolonepropionase [Bacteroidales bacterium]